MNLLPSTPAIEGPYEAAKWLKISVLADAEEFRELFLRLQPFGLYSLGSLLKKEELSVSSEGFLGQIQGWTDELRQGRAPKQRCALALSKDSSCLWLQELGDRFLVKIRRPVIQIQTHSFIVSQEEKTFHSMINGKESIFWGLQFSWPQIFMDPLKQDLCKVDATFSNQALFQTIRQWSRDCTRPVPFLVGGEKIFPTFRLGKRCFEWISVHPQLKLAGLEVVA